MLNISRASFTEAILDSIPQMIWTALPDGSCTFLNRRWYDFTGREKAEDPLSSWLDALHPDDQEQTLESWQCAARTNRKFESQFRLRRADGTFRWVLAQGEAEVHQDRVLGWYGTCTDIHEQVSATEAVQVAEARLRRTIDHIPQMTWSALPDGSHDYFSRAWYDFTRVPEGSTDGAGWNDMFHPEDQKRLWPRWRRSLQTGEPYEIDYRLRHHSGEYRWVLGRALPERDGDGQIVRWHGTCTDIHEQVTAEQALRGSEQLHRGILEASHDCIKVIGVDGSIELMNAPGMLAMELDSFDKIRGKNWLALWPARSRTTVAAAIEEARAKRPARFTGFCPTAKGTPRWWDVVVTPMTDEKGEVTRLLSISRDITATREAADKLLWTSEHDSLTTLPNREAFQAHLQAATLRAMESGGSVGLLLMDLDHFKHVNDTLGHAAGDHLLKTFGQRLKSCVRGTDLVARLGGDEFALILEGVTAQRELLIAGEGILTRLRAPIRYGERVLHTGVSIGGALFPADAASAHELFKNADTALYALKNAGRGGTRMFHNYMREEAQKVASQLSLARVALSEKSVIPHYQQKIELRNGIVCGFEALLRWNHPVRGIQLPDTVAEAFKDYELASKIGELMQSAVLRDIRAWQRTGIEFGRISINAAPAEFLRDDYAERLLDRLAEYQVPGELIEVEVTEHVFLERGSEYVSRALKLLNENGVRISLDDFGTGYSSLSHLRDFPVDVVKIDRSFIAKMVEEPEIRAIVSAVIDLAASLSLEVVAEGIETEEQQAMLLSQGCALGQGYLFGRAVIAEEVHVLLGAPHRAYLTG